MSFSPKKTTCLNPKQAIPPEEHLGKIRVLPHLQQAWAGSKSFPSWAPRTSVNRGSGLPGELDTEKS